MALSGCAPDDVRSRPIRAGNGRRPPCRAPDHVAIAPQLNEIAGAVWLARAADVRDAGAPRARGGAAVDARRGGWHRPARDFAHAREGAEARVGAPLLRAGLVGQVVGS